MAVLAQSSTLGAVGTKIDGGIKHRLLAHPNAVFNDGVNSATYRAMAADRSLDLDFSRACITARRGRRSFFNQCQLRGRQPDTHTET